MPGPRLTASGPRLTATGPRLTASGPRLTASGPRLTASGPKLTATGPKLTARPISGTRSISSSAAAAVPRNNNTGTIITNSKGTAPLARKYADLLRERNIEWDSHPRSIYTRSANRPHPPPQKLRIMQTFSTDAPAAAAAAQVGTTLDRMVIPGTAAEDAAIRDPYANIRVPLLPDNFLTSHVPEAVDGPLPMPEISIVAANPEMVQPAAMTEVEGMNIDGVELKFIYEDPQPAQKEPGMLSDIWKGLVDDVFGETGKSGGKFAV